MLVEIASVALALVTLTVSVVGVDELRCDLPRVKAGSTVGLKIFLRNFLGRKPVVLENATHAWRAHDLWKNGGFLSLHGDLRTEVRPEHVFDNDVSVYNISIREYLHEDRFAHSVCFNFDDYSTYYAIAKECQPVPDELLQIRKSVSFSVGRRGTGSGSHQHQEFWMSQVVGRKVWVVAPPQGPTIPENGRPCEVIGRMDSEMHSIKQCIVHEGTTLYVPHYWHHATCNIDDLTIGLGGMGNSQHFTPMLRAIQEGDSNTVRQFSPNNDWGSLSEALALTSRIGHVGIATILLDQRANPFLVSSHNNKPSTCMHIAASAGHVAMIELMLKREQSLIRAHKGTPDEPIHRAVAKGHLGCTTMFLSHAVPVSVQDHEGLKLTHLGAQSGNIDVMNQLLEHRADFQVEDSSGRIPLHWAVRYGRVDAVTWLLKRRSSVSSKIHNGEWENWQPIHIAASGGYLEIMNVLIYARANPDAQADFGQVVLHVAAHSGYAPVVERLLELRADPTVVDEKGKNPADFAEATGKTNIAAYIASAAVRTNRTKRWQRTLDL